MATLRLSLLSALVCVACTSAPVKSPTTLEAEQAQRRQELDARLRAAESRVSDLRREVANANQSQQQIQLTADSKVSVSWNGEAAPLVARLAKARGWSDKITGKQIMPIPIAIDVRDAELVDVLRDIGAQMGSRADLIMRSGEIELRYRTF